MTKISLTEVDAESILYTKYGLLGCDFLKVTMTKLMAEQVWLRYFNEYLFQRKLISEKDRNRMILLISSDKRYERMENITVREAG